MHLIQPPCHSSLTSKHRSIRSHIQAQNLAIIPDVSHWRARWRSKCMCLHQSFHVCVTLILCLAQQDTPVFSHRYGPSNERNYPDPFTTIWKGCRLYNKSTLLRTPGFNVLVTESGSFGESIVVKLQVAKILFPWSILMIYEEEKPLRAWEIRNSLNTSVVIGSQWR